MKQECVFFHTEKSPKETEKILKNEKMQVIFKSENAQLRLKDMTEEEKISWQNFQDEQMASYLKRIKELRDDWKTHFENFESRYNEFSNCLESYRKEGNRAEINKAIREKFGENIRHGSMRELYLIERLMEGDVPNILDNSEIHCSCIVAKQGENIVRYLKFLENKDPILTITGPRADNLKTSIRGKF